MPLLQWKDEFSIDHAEVDREHRDLIELINELYDDLNSGADAETVVDYLDQIEVSIGAHFALEERLMLECGYDKEEEHRADHERLLEDIVVIKDSFRLGLLISHEALGTRLDSWFSEHFQTHDALLHRSLEVTP